MNRFLETVASKLGKLTLPSFTLVRLTLLRTLVRVLVCIPQTALLTVFTHCMVIQITMTVILWQGQERLVI